MDSLPGTVSDQVLSQLLPHLKKWAEGTVGCGPSDRHSLASGGRQGSVAPGPGYGQAGPGPTWLVNGTMLAPGFGYRRPSSVPNQSVHESVCSLAAKSVGRASPTTHSAANGTPLALGAIGHAAPSDFAALRPLRAPLTVQTRAERNQSAQNTQNTQRTPNTSDVSCVAAGRQSSIAEARDDTDTVHGTDSLAETSVVGSPVQSQLPFFPDPQFPAPLHLPGYPSAHRRYLQRQLTLQNRRMRFAASPATFRSYSQT